MNNVIKPGNGVLFMKVGTHAQETLEKILERKLKEIDDAGFSMWGYGGNTCHPRTMVQPFARTFVERGQTIYLCMKEMESRHLADQVRAEQYSVDGIEWMDIPHTINVLGSRYALVIKNLRHEKFELQLANTQVAIGNSKGRKGDSYISGHVDKACLVITNPVSSPRVLEESPIRISLVADIVKPFAVLLRNKT